MHRNVIDCHTYVEYIPSAHDDTSETVIEDDTAVVSLVVVKEGLIDTLDFFSITFRESIMKPHTLFMHYFLSLSTYNVGSNTNTYATLLQYVHIIGCMHIRTYILEHL